MNHMIHKQVDYVSSIHPARVIDNNITANGYFAVARRNEM